MVGFFFIHTAEFFSLVFFFFKQKTAYEFGTGDWSSDGALPIYTVNTSISANRCSFIMINEYSRESYPGYRHSDTFGSCTLSVVLSTTPTTAKLSYNIAMYWYCYWLVYCLIVYSEDLPETGDPILDEYMRLYNSILSFKDGLAKILLDKGVFTRFLNLCISRSEVWITQLVSDLDLVLLLSLRYKMWLLVVSVMYVCVLCYCFCSRCSSQYLVKFTFHYTLISR